MTTYRSRRATTGAWQAEIRKAPTAASKLMKAKVETPISWDDSALVRAPASPPPMAVAGTHSQALSPTDARRTIA